MDGSVKNSENRVKDRPSLEDDFVVPKAKDRIAARIQLAGPIFVPPIFDVLASIEFHDQSATSTREIRYVSPDSNLSVEAVAVQLPIS